MDIKHFRLVGCGGRGNRLEASLATGCGKRGMWKYS
jgi:hypothetical protein